MTSILTYSPDSPLFVKKLNDYESENIHLIDHFKIICKRMQQFCNDMNKAAKSCYVLQDEIRNTFGGMKSQSKIHSMMNMMSDVLLEISSSQEILSSSLSNSFIPSIEEFCSDQLIKAVQCQQQYRKAKSLADEAMLRYLQSDVIGFSLTRTTGTSREHPNVHLTDLRAYDLVQHRKRFELTRFDMVSEINKVEKMKSFEIAETCVASLIAMRTHYHYCSEKLLSCDKYINSLNKQQQEERISFDNEQGLLATRRTELLKCLQTMVDRVGGHLPANVLEERDRLAQLTAERLDQVAAISGAVLQPEDAERVTSVASTAISKLTSFFGGFTSSASIGVATRPSHQQLPQLAVVNSIKSVPPDNTTVTRSTDFTPITPEVMDNSLLERGTSDSSKFVIVTTSDGTRNTDVSIAGNSSLDYSFMNKADEVIMKPVPLLEVESKLKALDKSELETFYIHNDMEEFAGVEKQGWVWLRGEGKILQKLWTREWLVLDNSKLYIIKAPERNGLSTEVQVLCDLMLASVRDNAKSSGVECPYTFEVAYANVKTYTFLSEGPKDQFSWISSIRSCIEKRLTLGFSASPYLQVPGSGMINIAPTSILTGAASKAQAAATLASTSLAITKRNQMQQMITELLTANPYCAECEKE